MTGRTKDVLTPAVPSSASLTCGRKNAFRSDSGEYG